MQKIRYRYDTAENEPWTGPAKIDHLEVLFGDRGVLRLRRTTPRPTYEPLQKGNYIISFFMNFLQSLRIHFRLFHDIFPMQISLLDFRLLTREDTVRVFSSEKERSCSCENPREEATTLVNTSIRTREDS